MLASFLLRARSEGWAALRGTLLFDHARVFLSVAT